MITAEELAKEIRVHPNWWCSPEKLAAHLLPFIQSRAARVQGAAVAIENLAKQMFDAQKDRLAVDWDKQWQPTKDYWIAKATSAVLATPQPPKDAGAVPDPLDGATTKGTTAWAGERAAFEKWLSGFPNPPPLTRTGEKQTYSYATTLAGWNAWMQRAVLAAAGMGQAAVRADAAPVCTCPSGDGSLRHPCPQHPPAEPAARMQDAATTCWQHRPGSQCPTPDSCRSNGCSAVERELFPELFPDDAHPSPAHAGAGDAEALAKLAIDTVAKKLYGLHTDNHPTMHCNRFPAWPELKDADREEWREKARRLAGGDHA